MADHKMAAVGGKRLRISFQIYMMPSGNTQFFTFNFHFLFLSKIKWTSKAVRAFILLLLCLFLLLFILYLIFNSIFAPYSIRSLYMYPPVCDECLKKNPSAVTNRAPSKVYIHYYSPAQARFEMIGNPPLKSNSFTAVDFDTV